jgi:dephospho-CoA kinase
LDDIEMMESMGSIVIGLTGGIGSGKSTALRVLQSCGAFCIDADKIAREITSKNGVAFSNIVHQVGVQYLTMDGDLDRRKLSKLVFSDSSAKLALEAITHPIIMDRMLTDVVQAKLMGQHVIILDIPLLVESGARWRKNLDFIIVIDCSVEVQRSRVALRNALSISEINDIIGTQANRNDRLAIADIVLSNQGSEISEFELSVRSAASVLELF